MREAFVGVEAFMGQRVHESIEWLFNERDAGRTRTDADTVGFYCAAWDQALAVTPRVVRVIKRGQPIENYRRRGAEMLARFHAERFSSDSLVTIANERHFRIRLGGCHGFQGYIDRLARDGCGLVHIIDYKTGRQAAATFQGKDAEQLEAYALAMFVETDADEIELVIEYLSTGKRLARRMLRVDAQAVERRLLERIGAAASATVFPPITGALCGWCGYNDLCEAYTGRSRRNAA